MARKRRRFGSSFKARVALESVKEVRTISELAKKHKLHATRVYPYLLRNLDQAAAEKKSVNIRTRRLPTRGAFS